MKPYPQQEDFKKLFSDEIDYEKYSKAQLDWMDSINTLASGVDCTGRLDHFLTEANREFLSGMAGENAVWSPLNVWIALAMLAETTGGESREQLRRLREREEALTAGLSAEQRARFETFMEAYTQYHGLSEKERFIAGFRLGSRLTAEALVENTGIS